MMSIKSMCSIVLFSFFTLWFLSSTAHAQTSPLTGEYYGTATITSPAALGTIDLAFNLEVGGGGAVNAATSYIIVDKTLLFPVVAPTVNGAEIDITVSEEGVMVNQANVKTTDVLASNGVVHIIDAVILPPGLVLPDFATAVDGSTWGAVKEEMSR